MNANDFLEILKENNIYLLATDSTLFENNANSIYENAIKCINEYLRKLYLKDSYKIENSEKETIYNCFINEIKKNLYVFSRIEINENLREKIYLSIDDLLNLSK